MHLWCNKRCTLVLMRAVILYAFRISGVSFVNRIYCNDGLLSPTCSTIRLNGHNSNINIMCRKIDAVTINLLTEKVVTWITNILYIIMYTPRSLLSLIPTVYSTGEKQRTKT